MMDGALSKQPKIVQPKEEDVRQGEGQMDVEMTDVGSGAEKSQVDPRGHGRGQSEAQMKEQQRRIEEMQKGLWQNRNAQAA